MDRQEVEQTLAYAEHHAEAGRSLDVLRGRIEFEAVQQQRAANMLALAAQLTAPTGVPALARLLRQEAAGIIGGEHAPSIIPAKDTPPL